MLDPASVLSANLKALAPSPIPIVGATNFVNTVCDYMEKVQAGSGGSPGILTMNRPIFISMMTSMLPVPDLSWVPNFVAAWLEAVSTGVITPGTVSNPVWIGSGGFDTNTLPSAAATITTLAAAATSLQSSLLSIVPDPTSPLPLANAINAATLEFTFLCIGLASPPAFTPIPIPFSAL